MNVGAVMSRDVRTIDVSAGLAKAFTQLREHNIRHLPVVDGDLLVGLLTSHDLRQALVPFRESEDGAVFYRLPKGVEIRDVMTRDITTLSPHAPIEDAAQIMIQQKIGCVPVIDRGELVGIITETDLLTVMVELLGALSSSVVLEVEIDGGQEELDLLLGDLGDAGATVVTVGQTEEAAGDLHRYAIRVRPPESAKKAVAAVEQAGHRVLSIIE